MIIRSSIPPVSLQASSARKREFKSLLSEAIARNTSFYFAHDVKVEFTWEIEERKRYETHIVADLDNLLKPLLDAATGPEGVLFDDNQVQQIGASWISVGYGWPEGFTLEFAALIPDEAVRRGGTFVEFTPSRCLYLPFDRDDPKLLIMVDSFRTVYAAVDELVADGMPPDEAHGLMPMARTFPRARLGRFTIVPHAEIR